jgi:hypothetical protein
VNVSPVVRFNLGTMRLAERWPRELGLCRRFAPTVALRRPGRRRPSAGRRPEAPDLSRPGTQKSAPILKRTRASGAVCVSACMARRSRMGVGGRGTFQKHRSFVCFAPSWRKEVRISGSNTHSHFISPHTLRPDIEKGLCVFPTSHYQNEVIVSKECNHERR